MTKPQHATSVRCLHKCIGRHDCACTDTPSHPHTIHVCRNAECVCHTAAAYGLTEVQGVYVPEGALLVRKAVQA